MLKITEGAPAASLQALPAPSNLAFFEMISLWRADKPCPQEIEVCTRQAPPKETLDPLELPLA